MERNTLTYMRWCKDDFQSHQAFVNIKALTSQMPDEQTAIPPAEQNTSTNIPSQQFVAEEETALLPSSMALKH